MKSNQTGIKRKEPNHHRKALKELRRVIGETQSQFAKHVGYSEELIHSVETGRCGVSPKFLKAVTIYTGADIAMKDGVAMTWLSERQFRKKDFRQWREMKVDDVIQHLCETVDGQAAEASRDERLHEFYFNAFEKITES